MKKRARFTRQKSRMLNQERVPKHPPQYYLGKKKPGQILYEALLRELRKVRKSR